jgi:hypothetical protein
MSSNRCSVIRRFVALTATSLVTSFLAGAAYAQLPITGAAIREVVRDYASELACGARATAIPPATVVRIGPGREHGKALFGPGDPIIVHGGTSQGLRVGQNYFVRRVTPDRFTEPGSDGVPTLSIHTAGWIRIVEAAPDAAIATITRACGAMQEGDYLEPFELPAVPTPGAQGSEPDYANPGRLLLGDDRRQMGAAGDLMVFDRGSDHGVRSGQRLTIFRQTVGGAGPVVRVGEATAMIVGAETTVVRIDRTTDAIYVGDLVAIHR